MATLSAVACIYRQLAIILNTDEMVLPDSTQRRRKLLVEFAICFGSPLYLMVAHTFVQPSRYYLLSISGCTPSFENSWLTIILIFIWPIILLVVAGAYCILVIYRLFKYRRDFSSILSSTMSRFNKSRFIRLFIMATALILFFFAVAFLVIVPNFQHGWHQFNWSEIRGPGWSHRIHYEQTWGVVTSDRWVEVAAGYALFAILGTGRDSMLLYKNMLAVLGLGRLFPRLNQTASTTSASPPRSPGQRSFTSTIASMSSRVKLIFHRGLKDDQSRG